MKTYLTIILTLSIHVLLTSQVAISARYVTNNSSPWDMAFEDQDVLNSGVEIGIGYWFRFKGVRLEYLPELSYTAFSSDKVDAKSYNAQFNVLIYALDFYSDCGTCPTFSKDGGLFKKGFHWILSPGASFIRGTSQSIAPANSPEASTFRLGLGAGVDIGFSNLFTITPFAMYNIGQKGLFEEAEDSRFNQFHLGLRGILRFDRNKW